VPRSEDDHTTVAPEAKPTSPGRLRDGGHSVCAERGRVERTPRVRPGHASPPGAGACGGDGGGGARNASSSPAAVGRAQPPHATPGGAQLIADPAPRLTAAVGAWACRSSDGGAELAVVPHCGPIA